MAESLSDFGFLPSTATKTWISLLDGRERPAHHAADGQVQPIGTPFIVEGESLMEPGDTSLGASEDNIIGCRCFMILEVP